jgi:hypothetical protein
MLTKNFLQLQTEVQRHVAADRVAQGSYNTCFIGCLAGGKDLPDFIESEYGIPLAVSRIAESIFEGLPSDEAAVFFAAFPDAVESDGKDLTRVCWQFLAAELRSLPPVAPEIQAVIDPVIDGMDLLSEGKEWPEEDASAAADAAARAVDWAVDWAVGWAASAAARAAASVAGWAAWAAARAGWAADRADRAAARVAVFRRQRDLLLKLIAEAPITQQENT